MIDVAPARRGLFALAGCLTALVLALAFSAAPAFAQEKAAEPKAAEPKAAEPKAADAKAPDAAAPAGGDKDELFLVWIVKISGVIGAIILALSIYFVATVFQLFRDFREDVAMPAALVKQAEEALEKRDFAGVYNLLKENPSFFAKTVSAGMADLPNGIEAATEACDRHADVLTVDMEKRIGMMAVLGTLGPMIGLLGTLKGMIGSFSVIARSDAALKASEVAAGISEALVLTFEGVALSVPAIFFYSFFRGRMMGISANATLAAHQFLRKFYTAYKAQRAGKA